MTTRLRASGHGTFTISARRARALCDGLQAQADALGRKWKRARCAYVDSDRCERIEGAQYELLDTAFAHDCELK